MSDARAQLADVRFILTNVLERDSGGEREQNSGGESGMLQTTLQ